MIALQHGHLLIGIESVRTGELRTYVTPATFTDNGLAMHQEIVGNAKGFVVTHVSSGLRLRGGMKQHQARAMLLALAGEDWTFAAERVTPKHADRVREVFEQACAVRQRRKRRKGAVAA